MKLVIKCSLKKDNTFEITFSDTETSLLNNHQRYVIRTLRFSPNSEKMVYFQFNRVAL